MTVPMNAVGNDHDYSLHKALLFKWAYLGLFLFIFIIFKHNFYRKTEFERIVRVENKQADH